MDDLIKREFNLWQESREEYLGLPYDKFKSDCPPLLYIGGNSLCDEHPRMLVVSLEPLHDRRTYGKQLEFLRANGPDSISRYRQWQLDFFSTFPKSIKPRQSTSYWSDIDALMSGWTGIDNRRPSFWDLLGECYVEIPLIPMHAGTHTPLSALPTEVRSQLRKLFRERLKKAISIFRPSAVLALGADCATETDSALIPANAHKVEVPLSPHQPGFGKVPCRYTRAILAYSAGTPPVVFGRGAPLSNWHRPNRNGIRELGLCMRTFWDADQRRHQQ